MIIKGEVIHGAQLGRKMGFPTANIDAQNIRVDNGVYYSRVSIDGKLYCGIGVRTYADKDDWVWKWNTGTESNMEAQKGEASDAMKRAGFVWGIGTELYSAPQIVIYEPKAEIKDRNGKLVCYDRFYVREIGYDEDENINRLIIAKGHTDVFSWPR